MKDGKEEDKIDGPLFPRLHVNDTDKRGPRAPPRNKMALYEQLSIPSQRFNLRSSTIPLPPHNAGTALVPSYTSSQGWGNEKHVFSPLYMPPQAPVHSSDRVYSQSSDGMKSNITRMEFERSIRHARTLVGTWPVDECGSLHQRGSNARDSWRKLDDVDDFRVPTFDQSGAVLKPLETSTDNVKSPHIDRSNGKRPTEAVVIGEFKNKSPSEKVTENSSAAKITFDKDGTTNICFAGKSLCGDSVLCQESAQNSDLSRTRNLNGNAIGRSGDASTVRNELFHKESHSKNRETSNSSAKCSQKDAANGTLDAERKDEVPEATIADSISGSEMSPDDVVGVIGPKHFWKARRAIVNQQRVFAMQVFELHRLIKVQTLIAGSPHLLLEGYPYLSKSPRKVPTKVLVPECNVNYQRQAVREKDDYQKPNQETETATEKNTGVPSQPVCEDGVNRGVESQVAKVCPSGNSALVPTANDSKPVPLCFHPPSNQWLVPVMSPSEGLVYKPYMGPCPPAGSFMSPIFGSCTPPSITPVAGDFVNPAYVVPVSHRNPIIGVLPGASSMVPDVLHRASAMVHNCFPSPYGIPTMNPIVSSSVVEQVSNLAGPQLSGQMVQQSRSSCNMSHPRSEAFSGGLWKFQASKGSDLLGSAASSPSERAKLEGKNALPLIRMAAGSKSSTSPSQSSGKDNQIRAIKVVPHNARSASESAARIFRSIQEERQQVDS